MSKVIHYVAKLTVPKLINAFYVGFTRYVHLHGIPATNAHLAFSALNGKDIS